MLQAAKRSCTIIVRSRVHATLIGMNEDGYRRNGGFGFCIDEPRAKVFVRSAPVFSLNDCRRSPLQAIEQTRLAKIAQSFTESPIQIEISGEMPSHFGFGSSTAIRLAVLEAIAAVTNKEVGRADIVRTSGRGGTSGIGVTTYFDGGLVFDVGVNHSRKELLPSSALEGVRPTPLIIAQFEMPDWKIGLCIPAGIPSQTEEQEIAFFKRACPIPALSTNETLYQVVYGAVSSARERDFKTFSETIKAIQRCTWKRLERELHGAPLLAVENEIYRAGACAVGMSSLGPGLFFLAENVDEITARLRAANPQHLWMTSSCHNSGRELVLQ